MDSEPAEFKSLNYKEHPATKGEGSTLQVLETTIDLELNLQRASGHQARRINPATASFRNIQYI